MATFTETKPGWQTTEFWLVVLANVLPELGAIDLGNTKIKAWLHIITVVGYALSRGLAKNGVANPEVAPAVADPDAVEADQGDKGAP